MPQITTYHVCLNIYHIAMMSGNHTSTFSVIIMDKAAMTQFLHFATDI